MNISKLNKLVETSKLNKTQIAAKCGISRTTLENLLSGADAKISTVESLASVLGIGVGYLFDDTSSNAIANGNNSVAAVNSNIGRDPFTEERVKYLERILDEKERTIQILMNK